MKCFNCNALRKPFNKLRFPFTKSPVPHLYKWGSYNILCNDCHLFNRWNCRKCRKPLKTIVCFFSSYFIFFLILIQFFCIISSSSSLPYLIFFLSLSQYLHSISILLLFCCAAFSLAYLVGSYFLLSYWRFFITVLSLSFHYLFFFSFSPL